MDEDWKSAHLNWIKSHKDFIPRFCEVDGWNPAKYLEMMTFTYSQPKCSQFHAKGYFYCDVKWYEQKKKLLQKLVNDTIDRSLHFITIGFNHQTFDIKHALSIINNILSFDWVISAKAVLEKHRENGEHPHVHFLIESVLPKSKILEKIWAAKGIKKIVLKKSFIDHKIAMPIHHKYILGDKQESKLPYVELDRQWRKENQIPELFEK